VAGTSKDRYAAETSKKREIKATIPVVIYSDTLNKGDKDEKR
jgi:hypothetical protein